MTTPSRIGLHNEHSGKLKLNHCGVNCVSDYARMRAHSYVCTNFCIYGITNNVQCTQTCMCSCAPMLQALFNHCMSRQVARVLQPQLQSVYCS